MEISSKRSSDWKTPLKHLFHSKPLSLTQSPSSSFKSREDTAKLKNKNSSFASRIINHVKGKLSFGARIIVGGGSGSVFGQIFIVKEGEKLLKAFQCHLCTTAGPIPGLLFISTENVAFCGERWINVTSSPGQVLATLPYKVLVPIRKIKRVNRSENVKNTEEKYIDIVTSDGLF
ncbi:lipoxygenase-like proteiny domain-containing protein 1-like [Gossypium australe]|uniref:Lipoxygenase-like proteiny domain-containing protein 1-like n=1 Tax=Gossypium australe TaxID=47621 RepID=A0A5B6UQP6_9ROSI|nr:lipoxygenase-like proteiny domain-containing protein 1-like [Gossypium australe]